MQHWSLTNDIDFQYIQPGKPTQNAYVERFNKTYRAGVLDTYLFDSLEEVREEIDCWIHDYNHHRPHYALGGLSPMMWKCGQQPCSTKAHAVPNHITTSGYNSNDENDKKTNLKTYSKGKLTISSIVLNIVSVTDGASVVKVKPHLFLQQQG